MVSFRSPAFVACALACALGSHGAWAQQKPVIRGHGQTGWGSAAPPTPGSASSQASRTAAFQGGVFGFPFDAHGLTAPGLGWLPGDPRNWTPYNGREEAGNSFAAQSPLRYPVDASLHEPYFSHADAAALDAQYREPAVNVAQGKNSYALPAPVRFCPNRGYYPEISDCPQGWLHFQPEPPR